jgi:hypothetical protein
MRFGIVWLLVMVAEAGFELAFRAYNKQQDALANTVLSKGRRFCSADIVSVVANNHMSEV